ncbi:hypothetical protein FAZ69_05760 [Trinickia terrae]|uniref:DUF1120 domain-containing protein n=1 Tax=Trinickia terrae TaxID=2571161 RepID=A0A4U1IBE8_9BURK|nr:hypothetical protein [Trinickia terrae]TKC90882.1 hypothetical protein FAZ69_05760 [Trinickia terrae]
MPSMNRALFVRFALPFALPVLAGLGAPEALAAPGCTLTSFDSVVDFGAMRPTSTGGATEFRPSPMRRTLSATCPDAAQMSVGFQGQVKDASQLKFGDKGAYTVRVTSARLDGETVQLARLQSAGAPPTAAPSGDLTLQPSDLFAPVSGQQLLSGKHLDITLEIAPVIPMDAVRINQEVALDAIMKLQLITP